MKMKEISLLCNILCHLTSSDSLHQVRSSVVHGVVRADSKYVPVVWYYILKLLLQWDRANRERIHINGKIP